VLDGPYAHAYVDAGDDDTPAPADEVARSGGHFEFPFTAFAGSGCSAAT
jgi:hypothetical protein